MAEIALTAVRVTRWSYPGAERKKPDLPATVTLTATPVSSCTDLRWRGGGSVGWLLCPDGEVLEGNVAVGAGFLRQPEDALADNAALDLVCAPGDG